jgi:site-specific DNA-methyltransferase (adenine-specific)
MTIRLHHGDCLPAMKQMKDNEYDLAIVDPPYGIQQHQGIQMGKWSRNIHTKKDWDNSIPSQEYFNELFRISKNQIIWGGNYFIDYLSNTRCMLVWDKKNGSNPISDCELAWTSFDSSVRKFVYNHIQEYNQKIERIHPTQKPVALYQWILSNYAKPGDKIIDTHLGSGSIAIACHDNKFDLDAWELDEEYYMKAKARLEAHQQQLQLF